MHHGDLCAHDGKLYVTVAIPEVREKKKVYDSNIYVYDCKDLALLKKYSLQGKTTAGLDGIDFYDGHFYVGDDKGREVDVPSNTILVFTPDFELVGKKTVPGLTWYGVQTITFAHDCFWFGNYARKSKTPTVQMDKDFNLVAKHAVDISVGALPLPKSAAGEPRLMSARIVRTKENKHSAELVPVVLRDGKLVRE